MQLEAPPKTTRLGWNEENIFVVLSDSAGFKLVIFDSFTLETKTIVRDMPKKTVDFLIVSPKYNKYFRMKLKLLRRTYSSIMKNLTEEYETFKTENLNQSPTKTLKRVKFISSRREFTAALKVSSKTPARNSPNVLDQFFDLLIAGFAELEIGSDIIDSLKSYLEDAHALGKKVWKKGDVLDRVLLFGAKSVYSVEGGVIRPKFPDLSVPDLKNFVFFPQVNLDISVSFDLQVDLLENVLIIFHQMYICFCNYKKHQMRTQIPSKGYSPKKLKISFIRKYENFHVRFTGTVPEENPHKRNFQIRQRNFPLKRSSHGYNSAQKARLRHRRF